MIKIFRYPTLRKKIIFSLLIIIAFRLLAHIPAPGVDLPAIRAFLERSVLFGMYDLFSGGGFQNFSIVTLGLGPYINVSIIIQMLTFMIPALEELQKEGEYGREKMNTYTKIFTLPVGLLQAYGIYFLLNRQGVIPPLSFFELSILLLTLTAGTMLLVWIGDLVSEYGIGNGTSLLIFVGIISRLPTAMLGFVTGITSDNLVNIIVFVLLALVVIASVVVVNEGTRNITIEYGRRGTRSQKVTNFLPLKINQVGVIPIIFAVSIVMIPSLVSGPLMAVENPFLQGVGVFLNNQFNGNALTYNLLYFLLVVGFTYFYTSIQFDPEKIADDIKKRGGFIPGIRPGSATSRYLKKIVTRITLPGAVFLGIIAILPFLVQAFIGVSSAMTIGGTGLLITVSVILETVRQIDSQMVTQSYESFLR
ncbi:preprotein translocase subunit SecY [Patescibacteria group bacterium]|nr:preprotein translocase subunit SecY [Patescibacteria group bacterium]